MSQLDTIDTHFATLIDAPSPEAIASRRLPRTDKRALVDVPPGERAKVQERWTLRQFILDVRAGLKEVKRLKREESRKRNRKLDATITMS